MAEEKRYTVTTPDYQTTIDLWVELTYDGSRSGTVPQRPVPVANSRPNNLRNTEYWLTDEEAELLKSDSRVDDVFNLESITPSKFAFQESDFNKTTTQSGAVGNWGLLRHVSPTNIYGTSTADPVGTYNYVLDGTGVDIVVIDSGIQADHPEFQDANGISRVQQIDWFTASGVSGTMPANFYTDYDGHGTHVAGTIAGKTFGWAKNAKIYSIKLDGLAGPSDPNSGMSTSNAFDVILGWHNAKAGSRPTIVNNSWGYEIYWRETENVMSFSAYEGTTYAIEGGTYRGTPWAGSTRDAARGLTGSQHIQVGPGGTIDNAIFAFPYRIPSVDADVSQLVSAGVIVCNAAGNSATKDDVVGGADYDNLISLTSLGTYYYHRGSSPHKGITDALQVGSISTSTFSSLESIASYSVKGPNVDVYAAGERIISATSNTNLSDTNTLYFNNSSFKQQKLGGTSMASPQVAGIAACLKQVHPDWSTGQIRNWIVGNSKPLLYSTGLDNDYGTGRSLLGGPNNLAFFPMNGSKVFSYQSS